MSTNKPKTIDEKVQDHYVVDVDFHNSVDLDTLLTYVESDAVRDIVEKHGPPAGHTRDWYPGYSVDATNRAEAVGRAATTDEIVEARGRLGVDAVLVNANFLLSVAVGRYPTVKNELVRAYNDYLLEEVVDTDRGVYGLLGVPHWDPAFAADEIDRLGDADGFVGAQGWFGFNRPLSGADHDPIFAKLVEYDLPFCLHGSGWHNQGSLDDGVESYLVAIAVEWSTAAMVTALNLIAGGVFDTYPDLDIVMQEAGVTWLPFLAHRADEAYQTHPEDVRFTAGMFERDSDYLDRQPSEYVFDNFSVSTQPISLPRQPRMAEAMLDLCHAEDTFLFSTDWPHGTLDSPTWVIENAAISDDLTERIYAENARALFDL